MSDLVGSALIINSSPNEVRVALLENGTPVEVHVERRAERGVVGNIYRGRVVRVLPGMQAAFVDIGIERTGFLYVNDALPHPVVTSTDEHGESFESGAAVGSKQPGELHEPGVDGSGSLAQAAAVPQSPRVGPEGGDTDLPATRRGFRPEPAANIADVLKQGQEILVQVQKEPIGAKGARLTRHVTLPGRHLVLMPFSDHIGVSHRIIDPLERARLREAVLELHDQGIGCIVRTAAEGCDAARLRREAQMLSQMWTEISQRGSRGPTPQLIFEDLDLALRAIRDFFGETVEKVICDGEEEFERIGEFLRSFAQEDSDRVELYRGPNPIFDHFGVEVELQRALERRVWLKSGGTIVVDQAEALTAIDVNSGRFVGKSNLEETITQINLEAVKEIAYQLRLRNIGGIIIIDFIDMSEAQNREKVLAALAEALSHDRAKTTIVRMSEIGLVEMTRKRVRESLGHLLTEGCPYCKARGFVKSEETVANEILRAVMRTLARAPAQRVLINTQPEIADYLYEVEAREMERIERLYHTEIVPVAREGFHRERYEIVTVS